MFADKCKEEPPQRKRRPRGSNSVGRGADAPGYWEGRLRRMGLGLNAGHNEHLTLYEHQLKGLVMDQFDGREFASFSGVEDVQRNLLADIRWQATDGESLEL